MNPANINSVAELCQALIRIPSENPSGAPHSRGEAQIAQFVAEFLQELGAAVEFEEIAQGRPNLYAAFPTRTDRRPRLMLAPHLDTVSAAGMTVDPFAATVRDGRIYGRGASDTKGPMAAMLWALKSVDLSTLEVAVAFFAFPFGFDVVERALLQQ